MHYHLSRFADNLGDPRGFRIHLTNSGLKKGLIQSNRGNRLHTFFQQSEVHCNYHDIFNKYITSECPKNIEYLAKLNFDYNMPLAQDQFQALAILSQLLSRPWMKRFYRDAITTYSHFEAFQQVI